MDVGRRIHVLLTGQLICETSFDPLSMTAHISWPVFCLMSVTKIFMPVSVISGCKWPYVHRSVYVCNIVSHAQRMVSVHRPPCHQHAAVLCPLAPSPTHSLALTSHVTRFFSLSVHFDLYVHQPATAFIDPLDTHTSTATPPPPMPSPISTCTEEEGAARGSCRCRARAASESTERSASSRNS